MNYFRNLQTPEVWQLLMEESWLINFIEFALIPDPLKLSIASSQSSAVICACVLQRATRAKWARAHFKLLMAVLCSLGAVVVTLEVKKVRHEYYIDIVSTLPSLHSFSAYVYLTPFQIIDPLFIN